MSVHPRSAVAVILALTVCIAIIGTGLAKALRGPDAPPLPEQVVAGLFDLLKVITGGLIGWLARKETDP